MKRSPAFPLVVSGPSGVGKTSLVACLLEREPACTRSLSVTTRGMRAGERAGASYRFVGEEQFLDLQASGELIESARYNGAWYGTPRRWMEERLAEGRCVVLNIEVQGGLQIRERYPEAVLVFVLPPSWEHLRARLTGRGTDDVGSVEQRLRRAHEELREVGHYGYVVVNDDLDRCSGDLVAIVRTERNRRLGWPTLSSAGT
jgi:guanylate kinase